MFRILLPLFFSAVMAAPAEHSIRAIPGKLPLRFEPNAGQWDAGVRFGARTPDSTLLLTGREALLKLHRGGGVVSISLEGSGTPAMEPLDRLPSRSNYFLGARKQDWHTGVANWARVRARNVYPGIDVVYYGSQGKLEYDFLLAPGADPGRIRMRFRGPGRLSVGPGGELVLSTRQARFVQMRPRVFQKGKEIAGRYRLLAADTAAFELARYDRSQPLTIDPVLSYSTLLGGTSDDAVTAVKPAPDGTFYIAGYISNTSLATRGGPYQDSQRGQRDGFLAQLDPRTGTVLYFTYIGGSGDDLINDMDVDAKGFVYLAGTTSSTDFPTAGQAQQSTLAGSETTDAFVLKMDPRAGENALVYSSYLGGSGNEQGNGVAADRNGNVYLTGSTRSEDFPYTANALQRGKWGVQDAFLAKFDISNATLAYATYLGGEVWDDGRSVTVTPSGDVYVTGATLSTNFQWTGNALHHQPLGGVDVFVTRIDFSKSGDDSLAYSTYLGGSGLEEASKITSDAEGKLLITGYTLSSDFPVTPGAVQPTYGGKGNAFIVRLDPTASPGEQLLYSSYLGGSGGDVGQSIFSDAAGNVYVTGYTLSRDFPVTRDALQGSWGGGVDSFLAKFNLKSPQLLYSTYMGYTGIHV
ncbi:MAG: SBBP repeat-containing protein, partial [Acidobacteria bacterium]|nr:SBBP repeat-containing protein [Acidobacteriota bacterium]